MKNFENMQMVVDQIRDEACALHSSVNQTYGGGGLPYGYHLSRVADAAMKYMNEVLAREEDFLPIIFGAYFHDAIEDARQTYNDVVKRACRYMPEEEAYMAAEIVYALTNDKGRTRAERAGEAYYKGIRETPYAPFVKLCDRYANLHFSHESTEGKPYMFGVYQKEWPHFIQAIRVETDDCRFHLPQAMIDDLEKLLGL